MSERVFKIDGIEIVVGIDDGETGPEVGIWDHETGDKDLTDSYIDHPVVVGWLKQAAREVVIESAGKLNSPIQLLDEEKGGKLPQTNLAGSFQRRNAALAQKTVQLLSSTFPVEQPIVEEALQNVTFPGRWQSNHAR